jgi:hypothetical protein
MQIPAKVSKPIQLVANIAILLLIGSNPLSSDI